MDDGFIGRRSIRLKGYDYSLSGAYFVTICSHNKNALFGNIENGRHTLSETGKIIKKVWEEIPIHYDGVDVDQSIVMPNHFHGIVILNGVNSLGQPQGVAPTISLSSVVHRFKSLTTTLYRKSKAGVEGLRYAGRLWQRNYYEHIIGNQKSLDKIRQYIYDNPSTWATDIENI